MEPGDENHVRIRSGFIVVFFIESIEFGTYKDVFFGHYSLQRIMIAFKSGCLLITSTKQSFVKAVHINDLQFSPVYNITDLVGECDHQQQSVVLSTAGRVKKNKVRVICSSVKVNLSDNSHLRL